MTYALTGIAVMTACTFANCIGLLLSFMDIGSIRAHEIGIKVVTAVFIFGFLLGSFGIFQMVRGTV